MIDLPEDKPADYPSPGDYVEKMVGAGYDSFSLPRGTPEFSGLFAFLYKIILGLEDRLYEN